MVAQIKTENGITPRQEKAIIALCSEATVQKAAEGLQMPLRTLYRWMNEDDFKAALRKARRESFSHAIALCQRYAPLAVNTLAKVMSEQDAPHHARVTAAATLLKFGREALELDDIAARVEQLEKAAGDAQKNKDNPQWNRN